MGEDEELPPEWQEEGFVSEEWWQLWREHGDALQDWLDGRGPDPGLFDFGAAKRPPGSESRLSWEDQPRIPSGPEGGRWTAENLNKPEGRRLSMAQVMKRAEGVVTDLARFYGMDDLKPDILEADVETARAVSAAHGELLRRPMVLLSPRFIERMRDRELGPGEFRVVAHEAAHLVSGVPYGPHPGFSQTYEEGGAEVLSLWWWAHRGPALGHADSVRRSAGWLSDPGDILAASLVYHDEFLDLMRRAASDVGSWDREKVVEKVVEVMKADHFGRLAFRDRTSPSFPLPEGVGAIADEFFPTSAAESLARWLVKPPGSSHAAKRPPGSESRLSWEDQPRIPSGPEGGRWTADLRPSTSGGPATPSQPLVPKGSPNGGKFAGKTMVSSGKRVPNHETSQTPRGVLASDLRVEAVNPDEWPSNAPIPLVIYHTPGGSRILVLPSEGRVPTDPPDPQELGDIASTADMISARTGSPNDIWLHQWTMKHGGAVGWYDTEYPDEININLSETRRTMEGLRERQKAKGVLAQEEWRTTAEWHSPVAMHVSPIAYTTAHEMGHSYDYAHPGQRKRRAAAGKAIQKHIAAHEGQDRPLGWATSAGLPQYACFGGMNEWYAECFAEWMLTSGKTDVPAARLFGEMLDWP